MQKYWYVPGELIVVEKLEPAIIKLLSKTPLGPSEAVPEVVVWAALSVFCQVTVPPVAIVTL
jgi:hypothetical protein